MARLQRYLKAGGVLLADACCGRVAFDMAFRQRDRQGVPRPASWRRSPADHPIYHSHYDIRTVEYTPRIREDFGQFDTPELEGSRSTAGWW